MKIYSIEEIVQATNNLYKRASNSDVKSKNTKNFKIENEPLILKDAIEEIPLKSEEEEKPKGTCKCSQTSRHVDCKEHGY